MRKLLLILALTLAAAGVQAVPLSSLLSGGSITAGDKLFDQWSVTFNEVSSFNDPRIAINTNNIDVTALNDGGLNPGPGLRFSVLNNELTISGDDVFAYIDFQFGFHVSVLDPTLKIKDNTLAYASGGAFWSIAVDGSYDVGSFIREDIGTAALLADLGTKNIEFSTLNNGQGQQFTNKISDSATFAPQSEIWVTKNLFVWAADATDSAGILGFEQRFSQIPEPATLALAGLALAGLAAVRRRKSV